jgi:hypothetical protein
MLLMYSQMMIVNVFEIMCIKIYCLKGMSPLCLQCGDEILSPTIHYYVLELTLGSWRLNLECERFYLPWGVKNHPGV